MRRIATIVATGAVAAAAAVTLAAAPASADTGSRLGALGASVTTDATTAWQTDGNSGLAGVSAKGRIGWITKGATVYMSITVRDTAKDGLMAGLEVKRPGYKAIVFCPPKGKSSYSASGKLTASGVKVREVLGHLKGNVFYISKKAKSYKKII